MLLGRTLLLPSDRMQITSSPSSVPSMSLATAGKRERAYRGRGWGIYSNWKLIHLEEGCLSYFRNDGQHLDTPRPIGRTALGFPPKLFRNCWIWVFSKKEFLFDHSKGSFLSCSCGQCHSQAPSEIPGKIPWESFRLPQIQRGWKLLLTKPLPSLKKKGRLQLDKTNKKEVSFMPFPLYDLWWHSSAATSPFLPWALHSWARQMRKLGLIKYTFATTHPELGVCAPNGDAADPGSWRNTAQIQP